MTEIDVTDLSQLDQFAQQFAKQLKKGDRIHLNGDLGSGKTTLTQMIVRHLGYEGRVKSPTYAIYEEYHLSIFQLIHMDLYRLSSAEEMYYLGLEEIFTEENVVIIEWPQRGKGVLPGPTKEISFEWLSSNKRRIVLDIT